MLHIPVKESIKTYTHAGMNWEDAEVQETGYAIKYKKCLLFHIAIRYKFSHRLWIRLCLIFWFRHSFTFPLQSNLFLIMPSATSSSPSPSPHPDPPPPTPPPLIPYQMSWPQQKIPFRSSPLHLICTTSRNLLDQVFFKEVLILYQPQNCLGLWQADICLLSNINVYYTWVVCIVYKPSVE